MSNSDVLCTKIVPLWSCTDLKQTITGQLTDKMMMSSLSLIKVSDHIICKNKVSDHSSNSFVFLIFVVSLPIAYSLICTLDPLLGNSHKDDKHDGYEFDSALILLQPIPFICMLCHFRLTIL